MKKAIKLLFIGLLVSGTFITGTRAADKTLLNVDKQGVAVQGYDPVAYFTDQHPVKGKPDFRSGYHGAIYQFATAEHKKFFDENPAKYEPQFGGYCAYGATRGYAVPIKVDAFQIVNDRLLLQYDQDVRATFAKDTAGNLKLADEKWPEIVAKKGK